MEFGIFDHLDRNDRPLGDYYEDRLQIIEAYDKAGFYGYHVAEHHSTPLGMAPSPSVFLAALVQRTERLRFGPLIYALPLYHPIRLIEEICMLDQMSGGRMEIGFGRGASPIELGLYGIDPDHAEGMYTEALEIVLAGLTGEPLSFHGAFYDFDKVPMTIQPVQKPHPPIWYGMHSPDSAERAARQALNVVSLDGAADTRVLVDRYRRVWRENGGIDATEPRIGMSRFIVIAETDHEALGAARRAYPVWHNSFNHLFRQYNSAPRHPRPPQFDDMVEIGQAVAGTPDKVAAFLESEIAESGITYMIGQFAFGDMTVAESLRSVDLFARHVMPELRK